MLKEYTEKEKGSTPSLLLLKQHFPFFHKEEYFLHSAMKI